MLWGDVLIGGEESGGITVRGHVPDGGGILMALMLLEIVSQHRAPLSRLLDELMARFGPLCYGRRDVRANAYYDKSALVSRLVAYAPDNVGDLPIARRSTTDGAKFYCADGAWLLIRPSGTEPVIRVYAEAASRDRVDALVNAGVRLVEMCLQARVGEYLETRS